MRLLLSAVLAPNGYCRKITEARNVGRICLHMAGKPSTPMCFLCLAHTSPVTLQHFLLMYCCNITWMMFCHFLNINLQECHLCFFTLRHIDVPCSPQLLGVILCSFSDRQDSNSTICQKIQPIPVMHPHCPAVTAIIIETKAQRSF